MHPLVIHAENMNLIKQPPLLAAVFAAVISVILFSGQRTHTPPQRPRQPVQMQQQPMPPRPATLPANGTPRPTPTPTSASTSAVPTPAPTSVPTPTPALPAAAAATPAVAEMPSLFWLPEDVQFPEGAPGASRTITLFGDPRAEGLYVTRTLIPKGAQTVPHFHPDSRTVTVLSGVCYYGRGEEFDETRTVAFPPGSFFTEPAGVPHFIWAKEGDVIVQTTAIGPSGTQIVPARNTGTVQ